MDGWSAFLKQLPFINCRKLPSRARRACNLLQFDLVYRALLFTVSAIFKPYQSNWRSTAGLWSRGSHRKHNVLVTEVNADCYGSSKMFFKKEKFHFQQLFVSRYRYKHTHSGSVVILTKSNKKRTRASNVYSLCCFKSFCGYSQHDVYDYLYCNVKAWSHSYHLERDDRKQTSAHGFFH